VEGIHLFAAIGCEGYVDRRPRAIGRGDGEVVGLFEPERDLSRTLRPRADLAEAQRQQRACIELAAAVEVAHADGQMVDHHTASRHTRQCSAGGESA